MSQSQVLNLDIKGLYLSPNDFSGSPQGALTVADNTVLNSKNLLESRRGFKQYGTALDILTGQVNKNFTYNNSIISNYDNKLAYDAGSGTFTPYSGTYLKPTGAVRMRSLVANQNFYLTTSEGILKLDALTATPTIAGAPEALSGTGTLTGVSGFLADDSAVAYRLVWGYRDANNNLVLGAPSQRLVVANSSGGTRNVILSYTIPDGITTSYFYQIYRSQGTAAAVDEPSDELQLAMEGNPTSGEITAKAFTVTDITPYSLLRTTLYTSPSQEGIANSNFRPPLAVDMDQFKECAFYGNTKREQTLNLALIGVDIPSFGYISETGDTTSGSPIITNIGDTSDLRVGMRARGTGIPTTAVIVSIDSATQVTVSANATATASGVTIEFQDRLTLKSVNFWGGSANVAASNTFQVVTSGTPGTNVEDTAINLVLIVNTASTSTLYAYYVSGVEDLPGQIRFTERTLGGAAFSATSTAGNSFSPVLPTTGTTVISTNDNKQNRVFISKPGQPEAVPVYRYFDIGSANFPIKRVISLRDGVFFLKEDGIFRVSGETFENFVVSPLDNTLSLLAPESAVSFNNQIFCMSTQGVCAISDSGVRIMSVPVENEVIKLSASQYANFEDASFGVGYESARIYAFFTVTEESDTYATQAWIYNLLTDAWTRWPLSATCGMVGPQNKLYLGQPDTGYILQERKTFTRFDYADEEYAVTISSVDSASQLTVSDDTNLVEGMTIVQGDVEAIILAVDDDVLTIVETPGFEAGAAIVYQPITNVVAWKAADAGNVGITKQFSELSFVFKNAAFNEIDLKFSSSAIPGSVEATLENAALLGWGEGEWGEFPWGGDLSGPAILRTYIPREAQMANWINIQMTLSQAFSAFALEGVSIIVSPMSSRIK